MKLNPIIALAALLPVQALAQDYDDYEDYDEDRSVDEEVLPQREEVVREVRR